MSATLRPFVFSLLLTLCSIHFVQAQPNKGRFIKASIGYGITLPLDEYNITGSGFYTQGEYVIGIRKWFGIRPYAGVIFTSPNETVTDANLLQYKVTAKAFMIGGKARIVAPIPYVAPYLELGLGTSIGSFETYTPATHIKANGVQFHVPFSLGLALGKKHDFELEFTYYTYPSLEQSSGAMALGFSFPLNR